MAKNEKKTPQTTDLGQPNNLAKRALIFEYVTNIDNVKLKTKDIAKAVGLSERHTREYLTPEFWEVVRDERRKKYAKHSVFVDEGLVKSAVKGNPKAAQLFFEKYEKWIPKKKVEHTGEAGGPIRTENMVITKEMSAKEAASIYARMIKEGNGDG